jgi:hypothetical protein
VYGALRSPDSAQILESFDLLAPEFPVGPAGDDPTAVYVAKVKAGAVPRPLPKDWVVASEDGEWAVVLAFVRSALSLKHFTVCVPRAGGDDDCVSSGLALPDEVKPACLYCVRGMPPLQRPGMQPFELRLTAKAAPGEARAIAMPRASSLHCVGSIASVPSGAGSISADHRTATWSGRAGGDSPEEVRLDWTIGSADCAMNSYTRLPPFFLDGDPQTVEQLERMGL